MARGSLIRAWPDVVRHYDGCESESLRAIQSLCELISGGPLGEHLYPWTSMYDLCISQTYETYPPSGPYLKVSAVNAGEVEFRYVDTDIEDRQWHRVVGPDEVVTRFLRFIDQLHWVARPTASAWRAGKT